MVSYTSTSRRPTINALEGSSSTTDSVLRLSRRRRLISAASLIASVLVAILINSLTSSPTLICGIALVSAVIIWVLFDQLLLTPPDDPATSVSQRAGRGGRIQGTRLVASAGASIREEARRGATIHGGEVLAEGADVYRTADRDGSIIDSDIEARE
jgi:hypothetical protein